MRVGVIKPAWFMSDLAEQYYIAWISSFNNKPRKIVCTWHVDRAWREHLKELKDLELQAAVYHNLRVLMDETNKDKFEVLLDRTRRELLASAKTKSFGKYFEKYYAKIKEQWAVCYRADSTLNTNMYVEAFHRVLKHVYMKGKVNKRLDKCIFILMTLARDRGFERLVKLEKGKNTERISQIKVRHQRSLKLNFKQIKPTEDNGVWEVTSSDSTNVYLIALQYAKCLNACSLCCPDCNVCVHMYTYTFADSLIGATICKHIHLIARYVSHKPSSIKPDDQSLLENLKNGLNDDMDSLRNQVQSEVLALAAHVHLINNIDVLKCIRSNIRSATNLIKTDKAMSKPHPLPLNNKEPSTKHIKPQRPFFSTKRKKMKATVRLAKPTVQEKYHICSILLDSNVPLYPDPGKSATTSLPPKDISKFLL